MPTQREPLMLNASYQGCSDKGLCYPPIEKTVSWLSWRNLSAIPPAPAVTVLSRK